MIRGKYSLLEQVSQCSTITLPGLLATCNLMGISFPHTLDRNQRYAFWFPFAWSQRDDSPSLAFTASCKISLCGAFTLKGAFMTRPKKDESLTKTKDVHLRMNETEYEILLERATATNMTVSDFIRNALNNQNIIIKYELTADVPEIKKLIGEFGKIGSNLNQIARYFNQGGIISTEMKNEIRKSLRDIYEMKYEVMKMAGDFRGSN